MRRLILIATLALAAQAPQTNYDEAKVGTYTLPDPLVFAGGKRVKNAQEWEKRRRPELLRLFEREMYGWAPREKDKIAIEHVGRDEPALEGKAIRKQRRIYFTEGNTRPWMDLLIYTPASRKPAPVFLGLNFTGNHTVNADPGIRIGEVWTRERKLQTATSARGSAASRWQAEKVIQAGYAVATAYYGDIEPDFNGGWPQGVRQNFLEPGKYKHDPDKSGAIAAWAWGLSRAADALEREADIDPKRIIVHGHSRLGKTALWAGALDTRFAIVISNDSGEGGAAISRRNYGETVERLNTSFPHWFCANYKKYSDHPEQLPFDSHTLISLIAPRPVYVASAEDDRWADPRGEFLGAFHAGPVYELYGKKGLGTDKMPPIHQPIMNTIGYHIRAGGHDITAYDWDQFIRFADMHLGK